MERQKDKDSKSEIPTDNVKIFHKKTETDRKAENNRKTDSQNILLQCQRWTNRQMDRETEMDRQTTSYLKFYLYTGHSQDIVMARIKGG